MPDPKAAAIGFEAVKISMSQTAAGTKITLVIHHDDPQAKDLFNDPVGSRYQVGMVLIDDEGQPVMPKRRTEGERAVVSAGMLVREPAFQKWLHTEKHVPLGEEAATIYIHTFCGISSRSELKDDDHARRRFDTLRLEFSQSRGGFP